MNAKDVMTTNVFTISPDARLVDAIASMLTHRVSGMPVVDAEGRLVGIVTEGDFLRRAELGTEAPRRRWLELLLGPGTDANEYARSHGRKVSEVMVRDVVTVGPEASLREIVDLMDEHHIKRLPVLEDRKVVGIVSRLDLLAALAEQLGHETSGTATDATIRNRIAREMNKHAWCPVHSLEITVHGGVVDLKGEIFDERQRRALHVLIGNTAGVKEIRDHLVLIEPLSGAIMDRD